MKKLVRLSAVIAALLLVFSFTACDDDDDDDGTYELSEWELKYSSSNYIWDWEIDFESDNTFEIDLDIETTSDWDVLDCVFARGTYSGNPATSSGTVTLNITSILTAYEQILSGNIATSAAMTNNPSLSGTTQAQITGTALVLTIDGTTIAADISESSSTTLITGSSAGYFTKTGGVRRTELSDWEYKLTQVSGYSEIDYELSFYSDDSFNIELDIKPSSGSEVDILFATGSYTASSGSASSSNAELTLTIKTIAEGYEDIIGGDYSNVDNSTGTSEPDSEITLSATISGNALTLKSEELLGSSTSWSFTRD